jgi:hypothetical protein
VAIHEARKRQVRKMKRKIRDFEWKEPLNQIISDWKNGDDSPLDGDEVEELVAIIHKKIDYLEGNITEEEYMQ